MPTEFEQLRSRLRARKVKVRLVPSRQLRDFAGMNDEAARKFGFRKLKDKTILIDKNLSAKTKVRTLRHEVIEMDLMEKKKYPYWKAHKIALREERHKLK